MDISKIRSYINYTPVLDKTPEQLFSHVLKKATYLNKTQRDAVKKAFYFADRYHAQCCRLSGELYMIHPVKVMEFLMELSPDTASLQVALLHDVIEDTPATYEEVKKEFGTEVADLCVGLEKIGKVKYRGEDRNIETLKKTFLAMSKDLRVIFIKLADRIHNIQTLHYHPKMEKRKRIAEETLKIFVPIAKRLGLYVFQGLLENGAFYQLHSKEYKRISDWLDKKYGDVDRFKMEGIDKLWQICTEDGMKPVDVQGRLKSPYRIYTKLQKYGDNDISKIMDVLAFRIITSSVSDCYSDLGAIHKHYTPIFSKLKDYIALPKQNGYKSLHTTVLGMFGFPIEIQIRTDEMDKIANYGVAAHFAYADSRKSVTVSDEQAQWIERLQKIVQQYQNGEDKDTFKHELDIEILQKNIFVYTPKGDIIELPQYSTVLDFAFRVHSDVGLKFKNAIVNNKIVPIDFKLNTGDIIDIQIFKNKYTANRGWLKFLHTPSAKNKLNKFLKQQEKNDVVQEITVLINAKLAEYNLPLLGNKDDKILKQYTTDQREQMLFKIRDKQISITKCIKQVYGDEIVETKGPGTNIPSLSPKPTEGTLSSSTRIIIDGNKKLDVIPCPECKPAHGDLIIARAGKDGIKIHRLDCVALETIDPSKLIEAHREDMAQKNYLIQILFAMYDAPGILLQLLKLFEYLAINISGLETGETGEPGWKTVKIYIELTNPSKLGFVIQEMKNQKHIGKILHYKLKA